LQQLIYLLQIEENVQLYIIVALSSSKVVKSSSKNVQNILKLAFEANLNEINFINIYSTFKVSLKKEEKDLSSKIRNEVLACKIFRL